MVDSAQLNYQLAQSLAADALEHCEAGRVDAALVCQIRAYSLNPGNSRLLQDARGIFELLGDTEAAGLCQRGVVPESVEQRFFHAREHRKLFIPSRRAAASRHWKAHAHERVPLPPPVRNDCVSNRPEFREKRTHSRGTFVSDLRNGSVWFDGLQCVCCTQCSIVSPGRTGWLMRVLSRCT